MKVLHITNMHPTLEEPHNGSFVRDQIDSLKAYTDCEISVYVIKGHGVRRYFRSLSELSKLIKKDWDLIHCHFGDTSTFVKFVNCGRKKIVTSYCGSDVMGDAGVGLARRLKKALIATINIWFARFDAIAIAKTETIAKMLKLPGGVRVVPNGVDVDAFKPYSRDEAIQKLKLDSNKKYVLFPGNPYRKVKNYVFVRNNIISDPDSVVFLTFDKSIHISLVPYYMAASHLIIFPSLKEGSPNVIKEAMACNRPILSSPVGDVAYLLDGVTNAFIFDLDEDKKLWQAQFDRLISEYRITNGRGKLIEKGLDEETIAKKIDDIYREVLQL